MYILGNRLLKVVVEASDTAAGRQSRIILPGSMIMGFALPFDLLRKPNQSQSYDKYGDQGVEQIT